MLPDSTTPRGDVRITLSTSSVYPGSAADAFILASELGYDGVEVMVLAEEATQDADALNVLASRHGVAVTSIHAPTLLLTQRVFGVSPQAKLQRSVELAAQVGAPAVVVHPPFRWQRSYAEQFEAVVREHASDAVRVCVENMFPWRVRGREIMAYAPGWDPLGHDYDHMTLDVSHAAIARQDVVELAATYGDRLAHVHLADGTSNGADEHMVPGRGSQRCGELLQMLARQGWSGDVVIEVNTRKVKNTAERRADLAEALAFTREHLVIGAGALSQHAG